MNNPAISKEELLDTAEKIVIRDGLSKLNMRNVAVECNISVGCIYNYYSSKSELVFALIERFWNRVFHTFTLSEESNRNFVLFLEEMYHPMIVGLEGFTSEFLNQISALNLAERTSGRKMEEYYWVHIKSEMLKVLHQDQSINSEVWTETFTQEVFIDFVFDNMMRALRNGDRDCSFLLEIIKLCIYK